MSSAPAPAQPSTVGDVIRRSAQRYPDRTALEFGARAWTYAGLDDAATRAARWLIGRGLRPGDRVATYGKNSDAYLLVWLGCCRAGLVHVPVNFNLTGADLAYLLGQSGSRAVLVDPGLRPALEYARDGRPDDVEWVADLRDAEGCFLADVLAAGEIRTQARVRRRPIRAISSTICRASPIPTWRNSSTPRAPRRCPRAR